MFRKQPYTIAELAEYARYLEGLDRLMEKAKRNYLGGGQTDYDRDIYYGYQRTLLIAQETYSRMLSKVAK